MGASSSVKPASGGCAAAVEEQEQPQHMTVVFAGSRNGMVWQAAENGINMYIHAHAYAGWV